MPFFAIPDFDAVVACLPSCIGADDPPKYAPLRVGEFMRRSNATDWTEDAPVRTADRSTAPTGAGAAIEPRLLKSR